MQIKPTILKNFRGAFWRNKKHQYDELKLVGPLDRRKIYDGRYLTQDTYTQNTITVKSNSKAHTLTIE